MRSICMKKLTEMITARLKEKRMSQADLAKRLAVTPQYVSQILNGGRNPTAENLANIEAALEMEDGALTRGRSRRPGSGRALPSLSKMRGVEVAYLKVTMDALREAMRVLHSQTPADALRPAQGKTDTLLFDAAAEDAITRKLRAFNDKCAIFTEESKDPLGGREYADRTCYFIDPFDRSTPFKALLETTLIKGRHKYVGDVVHDQENPLIGLQAPFGSITCIRDKQITFNVMMNYCTGETYVACKAMLKRGNIVDCPDPETLASFGTDIRFKAREGREFTCFLGRRDSEKRPQYERHLQDLSFRPGQHPPTNLQDPGGPPRILYLTDEGVTDPLLAGVLSNGEKICEWIGWLAYVAHSGELAAYELYAGNISQRDEILLAPPPDYSMFQIENGLCHLKLERILNLNTPVFYRGAILVAHFGSSDIITEMRVTKCRELVLNRHTQ
jgi:transcriptional regulator with XRE-family HTH domain